MAVLERPLAAASPAAWSASATSPDTIGADWRTWVAVDAPPARPLFERAVGRLTIRLPDDPAGFGKWISPPQAVVPGRRYRCRVWRATRGTSWPDHHAPAILSWRGSHAPPWTLGWKTAQADRGRDPALGMPVLVDRRTLFTASPDAPADRGASPPPQLSPDLHWQLLEVTLRAPAEAEAAELELWLHHAPGAQVWWGGAELIEAPERAPRIVTLGTVRATPQAGGTLEDNRALLVGLADQTAAAGAGIVCLPETATYHGTGMRNTEAAEPLQGPGGTVEALGRVAAARRVWIVAQFPERQGHHVYNTAVLIDREGKIAAHYHKMHLTYGELESGMLPGKGPVVAQTDFGKVGLLVCYDLHFPEAPRLTALAGAEVIFGPTAGDRWPERRDGGNRAHALANGIFLVTSLVQGPSDIIDPDGRILATAAEPNSIATARIDLDYKDTPEGRALGISSGLHNGGAYWLCRRPDLYGRFTTGAVR